MQPKERDSNEVMSSRSDTESQCNITPDAVTPISGASVLFSFAIGLGLFLCLAGQTNYWSPHGEVLFDTTRSVIPVVICLFVASFILCGAKLASLTLNPLGFGAALFVLFFSDWLTRPYSFFAGPSIRGELLLGTAVTLLLLGRKWKPFLSVFSLLVPVMLIWCFLTEADGRLLFSDDHPAFLYRLKLLKENFPNIPFYNPLWNAGVESREFFASGVLNLYFLSFFFIELFRVEQVYNLLVALVMYVLVPGCMYLAVRMATNDSATGKIAAILSVATGLLWYRWCLTYGAMGFVVSVALVPLTLVLVGQLFDKECEFTSGRAVLFVVCSTLMLFWSVMGLVFLPLCLLALCLMRTILKKRYSKAITAALLLLNIPWICSDLLFLVFFTCS